MVLESIITLTKATIKELLLKAFHMDLEDSLMPKEIYMKVGLSLEEEMALEYIKINLSHIVVNLKTIKNMEKESRKHQQHITKEYFNMIKNPQVSSNISLLLMKASLLTILLTEKAS